MKLINLVGRDVCVAGQLGACAPGRRAEMTALGNLGVMLQLLAGEKLKGRFTVVRGGRRGIGTAIDHSGLANWAARGGEAYVAPLWVAAFCCMMDRVWAVNGGQQM